MRVFAACRAVLMRCDLRHACMPAWGWLHGTGGRSRPRESRPEPRGHMELYGCINVRCGCHCVPASLEQGPRPAALVAMVHASAIECLYRRGDCANFLSARPIPLFSQCAAPGATDACNLRLCNAKLVLPPLGSGPSAGLSALKPCASENLVCLESHTHTRGKTPARIGVSTVALTIRMPAGSVYMTLGAAAVSTVAGAAAAVLAGGFLLHPAASGAGRKSSSTR